jgi:molecular chaperone GrpE (heat shock protein)
MSESSVPLASKWPFLVGDLCLLGTASGVAWLAHTGRIAWSLGIAGLLTLAVAIGAWILVTPFLRDQEAALRLQEQENLSDTLRQIQQLEKAASSIASGAAQLQSGQQSLDRAQSAASAIAQQLAADRKAFLEAQQRGHDQERQTLRLETEKLRRSEEECMRVVCHLLDHNFAVYQAGLRSAQPGVAHQLSQYRAACLDAVRRLGIVAHEANAGEPFNPEFHQTLDGQSVPAGTPITSTLACGYSIRGTPVRPIIVSIGTLESNLPAAAALAGIQPEPTLNPESSAESSAESPAAPDLTTPDSASLPSSDDSGPLPG